IDIEVTFGYANMDKVMRIIKQNQLKIVSQNLAMDCVLTVSTIKSKAKPITLKFNALKGVVAKSCEV
ncbi:MAG: YigZ family protein, partial [Maribacter sp.]|nr:YigZ family protein [Maribacter sp.]